MMRPSSLVCNVRTALAVVFGLVGLDCNRCFVGGIRRVDVALFVGLDV